MAVEHVKSTPVTNLDATPIVPSTAGEGGKGYLTEISGYVTAPASASADSTFRFVRVPTTAKIKAVVLASGAQGAGKVDVGLYYPTTGRTGVADLAANALDQDFFATDVDLASAVQPTDVTFEAGAGYILSEINTPLWQAAGLTSDPGGFLDIAATVHTTAVTTGTGVIMLSVRYVD